MLSLSLILTYLYWRIWFSHRVTGPAIILLTNPFNHGNIQTTTGFSHCKLTLEKLTGWKIRKCIFPEGRHPKKTREN